MHVELYEMLNFLLSFITSNLHVFVSFLIFFADAITFDKVSQPFLIKYIVWAYRGMKHAI